VRTKPKRQEPWQIGRQRVDGVTSGLATGERVDDNYRAPDPSVPEKFSESDAIAMDGRRGQSAGQRVGRLL